MVTREEIRYSLQRKLTELVGEAETAELMSVSPPVAWSELATKSDIVTLRGELLEKIGAMEGKIGAMEGKIGALEGKIGALDGKIGGLDGKIGAQVWKMYGASFASSVMTAGLVLGAIQLA